ncbi:unnamed protein product [Urochloa humidicola]
MASRERICMCAPLGGLGAVACCYSNGWAVAQRRGPGRAGGFRGRSKPSLVAAPQGAPPWPPAPAPTDSRIASRQPPTATQQPRGVAEGGPPERTAPVPATSTSSGAGSRDAWSGGVAIEENHGRSECGLGRV